MTQATGFIIALIEHDLISSPMVVLLQGKDQAVAAALEVAEVG